MRLENKIPIAEIATLRQTQGRLKLNDNLIEIASVPLEAESRNDNLQ